MERETERAIRDWHSDLDTAYKAAAKLKHPDVGGTEIEMSHVNRARDYALMELQP